MKPHHLFCILILLLLTVSALLWNSNRARIEQAEQIDALIENSRRLKTSAELYRDKGDYWYSAHMRTLTYFQAQQSNE